MDSNTYFAVGGHGRRRADGGHRLDRPGLGPGPAVDSALDAIARQPDASDRISRTLFVGLAMIESLAIYCLVIALILLFANPFTQLDSTSKP